MERFETRSAAGTKRVAGTILRRLLSLGRRPLILALSGDLGSGKTAFVQGLARSLGIRGRIQSPTFVLVRWHALPVRRGRAAPYRRLIHADAYRIKTIAEAKRLGLPEVFSDRDAIVAIEWADRIRQLIPRNAVWIHFRHGSKGVRSIEIKKSKFETGHKS